MERELIIGIFLVFIFSIFSSILVNRNIYKIQKREEYSFFKCSYCNSNLYIRDTIPVLSFLIRKGKCRYCNKKIKLRYIFIEILVPLLFLFIFIKFKFSFSTLIFFILVSTLVIASFVDIDIRIIPNRINLLIIFLGLITFSPSLNFYQISYQEKLIGAFSVSLFTFLIYLFLKAIGLGDVKLYFSLGLLFGYKYIILIFFISVFIGGIFSIFIVIKNKFKNLKNIDIPFGPFIAYINNNSNIFWRKYI